MSIARSRKEAKEFGLKKYFTGKPCKHGHISERMASCGGCSQCDKIRRKTDHYKEIAKRSIKSRKKTGEYKKTQERYWKSIKGRDAQKRYRSSLKGKETQRRFNEKYPNAKKSRDYYYSHIRPVEISLNCEKCSSMDRIEAHHHDYNLPMDVTFLCKGCHENWHKENTPLNRETGIFTIKGDR